MNKFAYLAALAALPSMVMVAPAQEEASLGEMVVALKLMSVVQFVETLEDDTLSPDQKADKIMEIAEALQSINELAAAIPAEEIEAAEIKISAELGDNLALLLTAVQGALEKCQQNDFWGSDKLRNAVRAYGEAFAK